MRLKKVSEVAVLLNTSERNVYHKIRNGIIPAVRIGRMTRICLEDLENLIGMHIPQAVTTLAINDGDQVTIEVSQ